MIRESLASVADVLWLPTTFLFAMLSLLLLLKTRHQPFSPARCIGLLVVGIPAFVLTSYLLFCFMTLRTEYMLVPWDQWGSLAPPRDTWERQLNDFFNRSPNYYLLAAAAVFVVTALMLLALRRATDNSVRARLPLVFVLGNLAFLVTAFLSSLFVEPLANLWLPQPRPPVDVGYHRTWPHVVTTLVLFGLLLWGQWKFASPSHWARHRND